MIGDTGRKLLGLPKPPTEEEIRTSLDPDKWRTLAYILDLIDDTRAAAGQPPVRPKSKFAAVVTSISTVPNGILTRLINAGQASRKVDNELTIEDMSASDDPELSSPTAIAEMRSGIGGRLRYVYRQGPGVRSREEDPTRVPNPNGKFLPV